MYLIQQLKTINRNLRIDDKHPILKIRQPQIHSATFKLECLQEIMRKRKENKIETFISNIQRKAIRITKKKNSKWNLKQLKSYFVVLDNLSIHQAFKPFPDLETCEPRKNSRSFA